MDAKQQLKKVRVTSIVIGILLLTSIGFFFYGLVNNIRMKQEQQLAIEAKAACEQHSAIIAEQLQSKEQQLMNALEETRRAKDFALEQARKAVKK
ncbi:MAG: hypothetical protein ORN54_07835 [Cyclobacteriaceae bacterium]|nr:hypothetical protein [Cyclobacteriaceae bacterium]